MKTALLLIDIQNDYFPGGKNELFEPVKAAENAARILDYFRKKKLPVFHVQHISGGENAGFFIPNTNGVKIHNLVAPLDSEQVVTKHVPNSFSGTSLKEELEKQQITDLVICGMMTHMCVDTTVRCAKYLGFSLTVIEDACTTQNQCFHDRMVSASDVQAAYMVPIRDCFANVLSANEWIAKN